MAFLRSISPPEARAVLAGERVYLRVPTMSDYAQWAEIRAVSREFLRPWEPLWPHDDLTRTAFRHRIRRYNRDIRDDASYPYFIFHGESDVLLGGITISSIHRGVAQSGSLGYWMGRPHANKGYMSDAVRTLIPYAFHELNLNRLEAACLPVNEPSIRLLRSCGFTQEGYAREYLKIAGKWSDHLLFALLKRDVPR
jgi:ribosomal-protein-alanine N-acetyltransferase